MDYNAIKGIIDKITLDIIFVDCANRCLINAFVYFGEYDLELCYIPGRFNTVPDAFSRFPAYITPIEAEWLKKNKDIIELDKIWHGKD